MAWKYLVEHTPKIKVSSATESSERWSFCWIRRLQKAPIGGERKEIVSQDGWVIV
jgi:hypothetical protein